MSEPRYFDRISSARRFSSSFSCSLLPAGVSQATGGLFRIQAAGAFFRNQESALFIRILSKQFANGSISNPNNANKKRNQEYVFVHFVDASSVQDRHVKDQKVQGLGVGRHFFRGTFSGRRGRSPRTTLPSYNMTIAVLAQGIAKQFKTN